MANAGFGRPNEPYSDRPAELGPELQPELFEGVVSRRVLAFLVDLVVLAVPVIVGSILVFLFGIVTLGLGLMLFWLFTPAVIVWALVYYGSTLGGPYSATIGMRAVDLEMRTVHGEACSTLQGATHPVLFWLSISAVTPLVLLVCFFNRRKRLLHDIVLGTVVINTERRARRVLGIDPTF